MMSTISGRRSRRRMTKRMSFTRAKPNQRVWRKVSLTSKTTEIRLATKAPALKETIVDMVSMFIGKWLILSCHIQTNAADSNCSVATRLVARWVAPIWVRSPNFITNAIKLMTTAAKR